MADSFKHPDVIDIPGALLTWWRDLRRAGAFLTCLPVAPRGAERVTDAAPAGASAGSDANAGAGFIGSSTENGLFDAAPEARGPIAIPFPGVGQAAAFFPLIGTGIGAISAVALLAAFELGLHPLACALVALAVSAAVTGGLHEDGLADFADGLGGGRTRQERLRIMRDSRIGTFGALACVFGVGIRASILSGLSSPDMAAVAVITAAAVSRASLPPVMRWQQPARSDGLSAAAGTPAYRQVIIAALLALAVSMVTVGFWTSLAIGFALVLAALAVSALAERTLGGQTGDVLGAVQVVAEIAALAAIAATE